MMAFVPPGSGHRSPQRMEPNAPDPTGKRGQGEPSRLPVVPDGRSCRCRGHEPHLEPLAGAGAVGIPPARSISIGQLQASRGFQLLRARGELGAPVGGRPVGQGQPRGARTPPRPAALAGAGKEPRCPAERAQPRCRSRGGERRQRGLSGRGPSCVRDVQTPPRCPPLFKGPRLNLPRLPCLGTHGTYCSQLEWDLGKVQRKGREHLFFRQHC